jgi:hypothetical protein
MDPNIVSANDAERARLRSLASKITGVELGRDLGGGWTVSTALAHIAFWDRRGKLLLDHWSAGRLPPENEPDWYDNVANEALFAEWRVIPPQEALRLALQAAEEIDRTAASLEASVVESILERGEGWRLARHNHRREHIDQIEAALAVSF